MPKITTKPKGKARRRVRIFTVRPYVRKIITDLNNNDPDVVKLRKDKMVGVNGEAMSNLSALAEQEVDRLIACTVDAIRHNGTQTLTPSAFLAAVKSSFVSDLSDPMHEFASKAYSKYQASFT